MTGFAIEDAALSGLRLLRRKPKTFAYWAGLNLAMAAAYCLFMWALFGSTLLKLPALIADDFKPDPSFVLGLVLRFLLVALILMPAALAFLAVQRAAATRAVLFPGDDRFGYLRLGADELRIAVVIFVVSLVNSAVQAAIAFVCAIFVMIVALSINNETAAPAFRQLANLIGWAVSAFVLLKLSLAPAETLHTRSIKIFSSWPLTKGLTWRIFLTYLLVAAICICIWLVFMTVFIGAAAALAAGQFSAWAALAKSDPAAVAQAVMKLLWPVIVGFIIVGSLLSPIFTALFYCPAAYIYRATRETAAQPAA